MKPGGFRKPASRLDEFAELLSLDIPPRVAARQMGLEPEQGDRLLKQLRERLGWQAV